jgi:hypothetical protein
LEDKRKYNGGAGRGQGRKSLVEEKSIKDLTAPHGGKVIDTLVSIVTNPDSKDADKIAAGKLLLAYGFGNPKSELDINNNISTDVPIDKWLNS